MRTGHVLAQDMVLPCSNSQIRHSPSTSAIFPLSEVFPVTSKPTPHLSEMQLEHGQVKQEGHSTAIGREEEGAAV